MCVCVCVCKREKARRKKIFEKKIFTDRMPASSFQSMFMARGLDISNQNKYSPFLNTHIRPQRTIHTTYVHILDISYNSPINNPIGMIHWTEIYSLLIMIWCTHLNCEIRFFLFRLIPFSNSRYLSLRTFSIVVRCLFVRMFDICPLGITDTHTHKHTHISH